MLEGAHSVHPATDFLLWARFVLGAGLVLALPGWLLAGRHLRHRDPLSRAVLCIGLGFLLLPLWTQATSLLGFGARPLQYLPVAWAVTGLLGQTSVGVDLATSLDRETPSPGWIGPALGLAVLVGAASIALGFGDFVVPPTTHDAANHAFMTLRITSVGSVDQAAVFGAPFGRPELPYALGLHATASMIGQTGGLAPYVATWFLALFAIALLPVAFSLLWDDWGAAPLALAIGALLVAANPYAPARFLYWGLFGAAGGFLSIPLLSLLLFRFWSSATVTLGVISGLATGSLMLIHGSEVPTAGVVTLVTIALTRRAPALRPAGWLAFLASMAVAGSFFFVELIPSYLEGGITSGTEFLETPDEFLERTRMLFGGNIVLQGLVAAAFAGALFERRTRPIALFAIGILAAAGALALWRDPISSALTTPYYRQPERTRYQLILFLPILVGMVAAILSARIGADRWPRSASVAAYVAGALLLIAPDLPANVERYRGQLHYAPVSADDYAQAAEIAETVEPGDWVLNQFFDGSAWMLHLSDAPFLVPTGWDLIDPEGVKNRNRVAQVLRGRPFSALPTRFAWLYVSDLRTGRPRGFTRAKADGNPALEPVLVGEHSTLYRIDRNASGRRR